MTEVPNRGRRWNPLAWAVLLLAAVVLAVVLLLLQAVLRPSEPDVVDVAVPDVIGLAERAAIQRIEVAGLTVGSRSEAPDANAEAGLVAAQDPQPGALVAPGSAVAYTVSLGAPQATGGAPSATTGSPPSDGGQAVNDYRCLTLDDATDAIERDGFTVGEVAYTSEGGPVDATWLVARQAPAAGERRETGAAIDLVLSNPFFVCPAAP